MEAVQELQELLKYSFMCLWSFWLILYFLIFFFFSRFPDFSSLKLQKLDPNQIGIWPLAFIQEQLSQELLTSFFFLCVYVGVMTSLCYLIIKLIPISRLL